MWKILCLECDKCICEDGKCTASMMHDSAITSDEVMNSYDEKIKTIPTNFSEKNIAFKTQNLYILLAILLITITLLMAVSIYCYMIIYQSKHLLSF